MTAPPPQTSEPERSPGPLIRLVRDQRVVFLIVGGFNTVVGFGFFVVADFALGPIVDAWAGKVVGTVAVLVASYIPSVLVAFTLQRRFTFKVTGHVVRDFLRFQSVNAVSVLINAIALPIVVGLGVPRVPAQAAIVVLTTVISYFGHRYFSFRRTAPSVLTDEDKLTD